MLNVGDILRLCPPDISKAERENITRVLYKNLIVLDDHRKQLLPLRSEIHTLKQSSTIVANVDYTKTCMRCRSSLSRCASAERCVRCNHPICSKCRVNFHHKSGTTYWLCSLCAKQRSFDVHSGDWINRFFPKTNPLFGNAYSLFPSGQQSSSGSYSSVTTTPVTGSTQILRTKAPTRAAPQAQYYRSEPHLDSGAARASNYGSLKEGPIGKSSLSVAYSEEMTNDAPPIDTWAITQSVADVANIAYRQTRHHGARGTGRNEVLATFPESDDQSGYDSTNGKGLSVSQPNLFNKDANLRGSQIRRPVRRRPSISTGVGKTTRKVHDSHGRLTLNSSNSSNSNETESSDVREIAVHARIKAYYDGRSKTGGGWLRLVFEDVTLVGSAIDIATSQTCQFVACFLPRENATLVWSKSAQLTRKNSRVDLEIQLPVFADEPTGFMIHISLWLLKQSFLGIGSPANDGRSNMKYAFLGEATYGFSELMRLGTGLNQVPLFKSLSEFPAIHASGSITFTITLHSADGFHKKLSQQSHLNHKTSGSGSGNQTNQVIHKTSTKRSASSDHLDINLLKITNLLLPEGIKKFQFCCKARLLPIKTDQVKTKTFSLGDDVASKMSYNVMQGGVIPTLDIPESCRHLCVADILGSQLAGGRCLEVVIVNKNRGGLLSGSLAGSNVKNVLGCIRLGSSASFDSTASEASVWTSLIENPDTPITATLPLRPSESTLLNISSSLL